MTILKLTVPSRGIPGPVLQALEDALHDFYGDTPMYKAWVLPDEPRPRIWSIEIATDEPPPDVE